jgi:hypothetical protein
MGRVSGSRVKAYWFNPRTGTSEDAGAFDNTGTHEFTCPSEGFGSDWVLVLDDEAKKFPAPGAASKP